MLVICGSGGSSAGTELGGFGGIDMFGVCELSLSVAAGGDRLCLAGIVLVCIDCCTVMFWLAALSVAAESAGSSECLLPSGDSVTDCLIVSSVVLALGSLWSALGSTPSFGECVCDVIDCSINRPTAICCVG